MALTLLCFALAERYPERRRLFLLLMYGAVGLGMLTKGPVAAALPGAGVRGLSARARRAAPGPRDDDSRRDPRRPGDRRALVRRALPSLRLDLHRVVLRRRERRALHRRGRRRDPARTVLLRAGGLQRFLPLVAGPVRGGGAVAGGSQAPRSAGRAFGRCAAGGADPHPDVAVDLRDSWGSFRSPPRSRTSTFSRSCRSSRRSRRC